MASTPSSEGKPQKSIQRGKGKALNALAAASGRDPALIAKEVAKAAAAKEEEESLKRLAEEERSRVQATPAGIYASLSPEEQYRFECFRRCAFPSKPIEEFVARAMIEEANIRCLVRRGVMVGLGVQSSSDSIGDLKSADIGQDTSATEVTDASGSEDQNQKAKRRKKRTKKSLLNEESKRRRDAMDQPLPYVAEGMSGQSGNRMLQQLPPLDDLVVPNSASEIVSVVSTLAKCYAQRLVAAARRVADAEEEAKLQSSDAEEHQTEENGEHAVAPDTKLKALQPHHYMEAHRHRVNAGIDPGFWMLDMIKKGRNQTPFIKSAGIAGAAAVGRKNWNSAHLAALAAQDEYDEMLKEEQEGEEGSADENGDQKLIDIDQGEK
jgi:hypothetical protein